MGRREARGVEDRIHLDTLVRIRVYTARSDVTGEHNGPPTTDETVWAAVESGRSTLNVDRQATVLTFPQAYAVRWDSRWDSLEGKRVTLTVEGDREDDVTDILRIGRRRFLRLEVGA